MASRLPVRHQILAVLLAVSVVSFADRASLSITGAALSKDLHLSPVLLGYIFSAFSWAYVAGQLPSGVLLDRFGSKMVYGIGFFCWGLLTFLQGFVGMLQPLFGVAALIALRFLLGLAAAPVFPGNSRIVSAWFPGAERGMASAVFASAQYLSLIIFCPLIGWLTQAFGWEWVFFLMGMVGVLLASIWPRLVFSPMDHPRVTASELEHIEGGGGLVRMDHVRTQGRNTGLSGWRCLKKLLGSRMMIGIYFGQAFLTTVTWFFLTWFPLYLVEEKGMTILKAGVVVIVPAICGFIGVMTGGALSDRLLRRGSSLTLARKTPIALGMLLSMSIIGCVYVRGAWPVVALMSLALFGRGIGTMGWTVISDVSPKDAAGLSGGLFNTFSNLSGVTTPIVIGYIVQRTGSYDGALLFIGVTPMLAMLSFLLVVGKLERLEFDDPDLDGRIPTQGG
jgi:MFS transporter, ACS family, glucarate transporter